MAATAATWSLNGPIEMEFGGSVTFNQTTDQTLNNFIFGNGSITQSGPGKLTLGGNNAYFGTTTIGPGATLAVTNSNALGLPTGPVVLDGGTLQAGAAGLNVQNAATITNNNGTIDANGFAFAYSGPISGNAVILTIMDSANAGGSVTLSGSGFSNYSGATDVTSGTLIIGNNTAVGGSSLNLSPGTTLSFLNTGNFTLTNFISIAGDPFFTPPAGTTQTLAGAISDGATPGTLEMSGAGTLVLSATNSYTGPTNVNSGTLEVDGAIAKSSLTTVFSGATLSGFGVVGNAQINGGGTLSPGTPAFPTAQLTFNGNLAFQAGALYLVQVNTTTPSFPNVNVNGTTTLAGNVQAVFPAGGGVVSQYTILSATGFGGTKFASLGTTNLPPGFTASLTYTATDVDLTLNSALGANAPAGGFNVNQQNVATSLSNFFNSGGTLTPGFFNVFGLSGNNLANALTQLSGEPAADSQDGAFQLMSEFLGMMLDPFVHGGNAGGNAAGGMASGFAAEQPANFPPDVALAYDAVMGKPQPAAFAQRWTAWGSAFGGSNDTRGDAAVGSHDVSARSFGFAGGMDYRLTPDSVVGFALAGGGTNWGLAQGLGGGRSDAFQAGLYGTTQAGPAYLAAAFGFANHWMTTSRTAFAGDQLTAKFQGQSYGGRAEAGYRFAVATASGVTPYAAIQAQAFHTPAYSETDLSGGGFALNYNAMHATDTRSEAGARFDTWQILGGMPLLLHARAAWAHDWVSNPALGAVFQALPGASFTVNGAAPPQNSALASAGAELHVTPALSLAARFDGEFANRAQTYAGTGTLRYSW